MEYFTFCNILVRFQVLEMMMTVWYSALLIPTRNAQVHIVLAAELVMIIFEFIAMDLLTPQNRFGHLQLCQIY